MIESAELKSIMLDILTKFARICDENGLRYFLGAGTLLGAVRHKGFIPWDDDVDVYMPRPDYMKLISLCPAILDENLDLFVHYNQKDYYHPFARICDMRTVYRETKAQSCEMGVNIDIFPIDGLPTEISASNRFFKRINFLHRMRLLSVKITLTKWSPLEWLSKMPFALYARLLGPTYWVRKIDKLVSKYDFETSEYVGMLVTIAYGNRERVDKDAFSSYTDIEFEGRTFKAPAGYDRYLRSVYGDYMTPLPENKRNTRHFYEAYWKTDGIGGQQRPSGQGRVASD